jgi:hypothetical protein
MACEPQGFEFNMDGRLLSEARAGHAPILCSLLPADKPNHYSLCDPRLWDTGATHLIQTEVGVCVGGG